MKWLIDLIIEQIGVPPCYIDRGDPADYDLVQGDMTLDNDHHDFDLSSIVPEGATAVHLRVLLKNTIVNKRIEFRKKGNVNTRNTAQCTTQVANVTLNNDVIVAVGESRIIEYWANAGGWVSISIVVRGWIL